MLTHFCPGRFAVGGTAREGGSNWRSSLPPWQDARHQDGGQVIQFILKLYVDLLIFRYAREKPKKSEEKKQKRAKRDEAQHSMKVALGFFLQLMLFIM